jgi:hypothetical protein
MSKKTMKVRILELHEHNTKLSMKELALAVGTSQAYVCMCLKRKGCGKTIALNQFGVRVGTKADKATAMFIDGCTMKEVERELGNTFYGLLGQLKSRGHKIVETTNVLGQRVFTLVPSGLEIVQ